MEYPGMKSNTDRATNWQKYQQNMEVVNTRRFLSWSSIKSPTTKKMLIIDYCDLQKRKLGITNDERNVLLTLINLNITSGNINAINIIMTNSYIYCINNIVWMSYNRSFVVTPNYTNSTKKKSVQNIDTTYDHKKQKNIQFHKEWEKYVSLISGDKKSNKPNATTSTFYSTSDIEIPIITP